MNKGSIVERRCSDLDRKGPRYKSPTLLYFTLAAAPINIDRQIIVIVCIIISCRVTESCVLIVSSTAVCGLFVVRTPLQRRSSACGRAAACSSHMMAMSDVSWRWEATDVRVIDAYEAPNECMASWLRKTLRRFVLSIVFAALCTATTVLLLSTRGGDSASNETASETDILNATESRTCLSVETPYVDSDRNICRPLLEGSDKRPDREPVVRPPESSMTTHDYIQLASTDCHCFRSQLGYFTAADTTPDERAFPIAFSLLTYENLEQTERLLRLVYRPHNAYCIHLDRKADDAMREGVETVASCLPNVVVARPEISVRWGEITVVQAELLCIGYLLAHSGVNWKYYINLVARDLPLRTNAELVKILKAYDGANDIEGTRKV